MISFSEVLREENQGLTCSPRVTILVLDMLLLMKFLIVVAWTEVALLCVCGAANGKLVVGELLRRSVIAACIALIITIGTIQHLSEQCPSRYHP